MASALKTVSRCGTTAFSPTAQLMAVGTMAGAIDLSFSTTACLEVYRLDLESPNREMGLAGGAVATTERFHRLAWSPSGTESGELPYGLIAGGLVDGTVNLWNPAKVLGGAGCEEPGDTTSGALLASLQKHAGGVKGLQFNPFSPNLLASGAADGELCIWDVGSPGAPSLYPALKGGSTAAGGAGEVTFLAWNCKVQHILASTSAGGTTVVWDLKRQKQVISFTDPNGARRCSALAWNPEVATQLITCSDDDRSPVLQVWDLRNSISPAREFSGHSKGVLAMAWCAQDPQLLLTCGKDNRTLCWDAPSGEVVAELPASTNWNFDVQWSPSTPGLLCASSFDAKVSLFNVLTAQPVPSHGALLAARAPSWLRRPCGAAFGFGGRLVSFGARGDAAAVTLRTVPLQPQSQGGAAAAESAEDGAFQEAVGGGDAEALKAFCAARAAACAAQPAEAETWHFLRILLDGEQARQLLLRHLQYEEPAPQPPQQLQPEGALAGADADARIDDPPAAAEPAAATAEDDEDFFENLSSTPRSPRTEDAAPAHTHPSAPAAAPAPAPVPDAGCCEAGDEDDVAIQRALVVGDYPTAVATCLRCGRLGDALVLASVGGTELWLSTQGEYMRRTQRPYLSLVAAVMKSDLQGLVKARPASSWRETLAMLCTYAPQGEWGALAAVLASRLQAQGQSQAALLCYICAGDVDAAVAHWAGGVECSGSSGGSLPELRRVVEKSVVLSRAAAQRPASAALTGVVNTYAELLAAQGRLEQAMQYLQLVPGGDSAESAVLRDRIYHSSRSAAAPPPPQVQAQQARATAQAAPAGFAPQPPPAQLLGSRPGGGAGYAPQQPAAAQAYAPQQAAAPPRAQQSYAPSPQQGLSYSPQQPSAAAAAAYTPPPVAPQSAYAPPQAPLAYAPAYAAALPQHYAPPPPAAYAPQPVSAPPQHSPQQAFMPAPPAGAPPPPVAPPRFQPSVVAASPPPHPAQPRAFQAAAPEPAPAPPPPPPPPAAHVPPASVSVESVGTSEVSPEARPVVQSLSALYAACVAAAAGSAGKKRELDDSSRRLGALFWRLNRRDVSPSVTAKLLQLCAALDRGDYPAAAQLQVQLTSSDWDECSTWLPALKRLVKTRAAL